MQINNSYTTDYNKSGLNNFEKAAAATVVTGALGGTIGYLLPPSKDIFARVGLNENLKHFRNHAQLLNEIKNLKAGELSREQTKGMSELFKIFHTDNISKIERVVKRRLKIYDGSLAKKMSRYIKTHKNLAEGFTQRTANAQTVLEFAKKEKEAALNMWKRIMQDSICVGEHKTLIRKTKLIKGAGIGVLSAIGGLAGAITGNWYSSHKAKKAD